MNKKESLKGSLKELLLGQKNFNQKTIKELTKNDVLSELINKNYLLRNKYLHNKHIKETLILIHEEILSKKINKKTFPPGTFKGEQGRLNCVILTKHLIEDKLGWSLAQTLQNINYKLLYEHKLRCVKTKFNHLYELILALYPDENLKPYYFRKATNVWKDKNGKMNELMIKEAIKEFISTLTDPKGAYKKDIKKMPQWANYDLFKQKILPYNTNLSYLLSSCFNNSHIQALIFAYPEMNLKPHYFSNVPNNYWRGSEGLNNATTVMQELIFILTNPKGKYNLKLEELPDLFKFKTYSKPVLPYRKNLRGMLQVVFKNSPSKPFELINKNQELTRIDTTQQVI